MIALILILFLHTYLPCGLALASFFRHSCLTSEERCIAEYIAWCSCVLFPVYCKNVYNAVPYVVIIVIVLSVVKLLNVSGALPYRSVS